MTCVSKRMCRFVPSSVRILVRALLLPSGMPVSVSLPSVSPFQALSSPHPACPAVPAAFCLDRELSATLLRRQPIVTHRPMLATKFDVKRGLRNEDGTGVLVGLTRIGNVVGYELFQA